MAARHHWLHVVSVDGEPTAVVMLKMLACAVRAAAQAAQYELLRVDQMVFVAWRFFTVAHGALSVDPDPGGIQTQR